MCHQALPVVLLSEKHLPQKSSHLETTLINGQSVYFFLSRNIADLYLDWALIH